MNERDELDLVRIELAKLLIGQDVDAATFEASWHNVPLATWVVRKAKRLDAAEDLLARNLLAWDDEEDSVKAEHRALIRETREFLE